MSSARKITLLAIFLALLSPIFCAHIEAQAAPASVAEADFRAWLLPFEKGGAKISPFVARYDAETDTLEVDGLSISWPVLDTSNIPARAFQFTIGNLTIQAFRSNSQGFSFQGFAAKVVEATQPGSAEPLVRMDQFTAEAGQIPSFLGFIADPTKPFTTQIRMMRLLSDAKLQNAAAKAIEFPGNFAVGAARLEAFSGGKAKSVKIERVGHGPRPVDTSLQSGGSLSVETVEVDNIDLNPYLRLFEPSAYLDSGSSRPWLSMIDGVSVRGLSFVNGPLSISVDNAKAGPLKIKQFNEDLSGIFDRAGLDPNFLEQNPQSTQKVVAATRGSFVIDAVSAGDVAVTGQNTNGPISLRLAKLAVDQLSANGVLQANASDLVIVDATGEISLASLGVGGINLVEVSADDGKTSRSANPATSIVPTVNSVNAGQVSLKLHDTALRLDRFELEMAYFIGAIPTNLKVKIGNLKFLTSQVTNPAFKQALTDLGYSTVDMSVDFSGNWDDTSSSILLDNMRIVGDEMGTLSISGAFPGITRAGLQSPGTVLPQELSKTGIKNIRVTFENDSVFERFIAKLAQANGKNVDDIKKILSANIPNIFSGICRCRSKY